MADIKPPEILIPSEYARLLDRDWREAIVEGGRYSLKSHTIGRICLIRALTEKTRILCGREFQNSISESVHQLLADLIEYYGLDMFVVTRDSISNPQNGSDFIFKGVRHNTQSIKSIEGVDIFWGEESQTFTRESIDIITPTIRKPGSQIIWTMNRLLELDPIYERLVVNQMPNTLHINANYDVAEKYGWLPAEIKTEIEFDRINNPAVYTHKWLGQPLSQLDNAILGREGIMAAMQRQVDDEGAEEIGADIARFGDDRIVFYKRKGLRVLEKRVYSKLRTTEVCDRLEEFAGYDKNVLIKVDDTGVGGGVTDEMIARGYRVMPINFGAKANDPDKYPNVISEAWFYLATILPQIQLSPENRIDTDLLMELSGRLWKMDSKGRRGVESKDDYKKRGNRSPDLADALILCFFNLDLQSVVYETDESDEDLNDGLLDEVF
ncbi:PBSX family phage terminase large subunit [Nocardia sp. NPDC050697]|uniref:PBSX family phage terminase large subunit n=1 Tax=Nocardia sp. NPDC050697 TaxID=3155158 RepID=UPI00340F9365